MTSLQEWISLHTAKFRLWSLAVYDRTDNAATQLMADLVNELLAAHIMDWYGDALRADTQGIALIEWSELLKFVQASRSDFWPAAKTAPPRIAPTTSRKTNTAVRKQGREPKEFVRLTNAMRADIQEGRCTSDDLLAMSDKALMNKYGAKRTTVRKACNAVAVAAKAGATPEILFGN